VRTYDHLYIDGAWVSPTVPASPTQVYSAADGSVVATVPAGSPADVDVAVDAARRAFDSWSQTTPAERAALITALADALEARADELAEMTAVEVGMPKKLARRVQIGGPLISLRAFADILGTYEFSREVNNSLVV
jgi:acyl-CoA reductase-like NAD-dependent aldehyde dehydrogenase